MHRLMSATEKCEHLKGNSDHPMKRVAMPMILAPAQFVEVLSKDAIQSIYTEEMTNHSKEIPDIKCLSWKATDPRLMWVPSGSATFKEICGLARKVTARGPAWLSGLLEAQSFGGIFVITGTFAFMSRPRQQSDRPIVWDLICLRFIHIIFLVQQVVVGCVSGGGEPMGEPDLFHLFSC